MKMRILIPSAIIELTGEIQACLSLANQQGFETEQIELGVSSTQSIELVSSSSSSTTKPLVIATDLSKGLSHPNQEYSHSLLYQQIDLIELELSNQSEIYLNVADSSSMLDVWSHPLTGETRALKRAPKQQDRDPLRHLSWTVTLLALNFPIEDALTLARAMMSVSRETWAHRFEHFPNPLLEDERLGITVGWSIGKKASSVSFPTLSRDSLGLYPVVDDVSWVKRLLHMGVNTIQLRIKDSQQTDLEQQIIEAIELGKQYNAQVFINDHWQLAIKHGAFGVHLGQEDIDDSNLQILADSDIRLGLSTHGYYELLRIIQINPSYIALGHIFPTTTKQMPSLPQGLVRLKLYQQLINTIPYGPDVGFPTVAIGGIDLDNAQQVWQCGVSSLAVVRAITLSQQPQEVVNRFKKIMDVSEVIDQVEGV